MSLALHDPAQQAKKVRQYFSSKVKNSSKEAYEFHYGSEKTRLLLVDFNARLDRYKKRLEDGNPDRSEKDKRELIRIVWYYQGLVDQKYDWLSLKAVWETHKKLDLIATDYMQPKLWQQNRMPPFEARLARMFGQSVP